MVLPLLHRSALRPFGSSVCTATMIGNALKPRSFSSVAAHSQRICRPMAAAARTATLSSSRAQAPAHPLLLTALGFSIPLYALRPRSLTHNDTNGAAEFSSSPYSHGRDAKTPLSKDGGKTLNPGAVRQISLGGMLGLGVGLIVSAFSRSLVLLLGIGLVAWQWAARRGYNIIPVQRIQRYVRGINVRSAINDNVAFKISFGLMFALSAFGHF